MGTKKDYLNTPLYKEVEKKIYSINIVRTMRINKSQRLYWYAEKWKNIFFWMNLEAVVFLIVSLVLINKMDNNISLIVSGVFSVYTILLQYYIDSLNFNERALRLHYHQLQLEQFILELKEVIFKWQDTETMSVDEYLNIMRKYQLELGGYENHDEIDREKAIEESKENKNNEAIIPETRNTVWSFIKGNIFMISQIILMVLFLIGYIATPFLTK